jgi:hypothetical protein
MLDSERASASAVGTSNGIGREPTNATAADGSGSVEEGVAVRS